MTAYLYQWIERIAFYLILVTVVLQVLPDNDYRKYLRFFTGLILILLLAGPILNLFGMGENLSAYYEEAVRAQERQEDQMENFREVFGEKSGEAEEERAENAQSQIEVEAIQIE